VEWYGAAESLRLCAGKTALVNQKKMSAKLTGGIRSDEAHAWRTENIGRLLLHCFRVHENRILTRTHEAGYPEVRRGFLNVLRHIDFEGTRLIELARRANVTKAAMGQLVAACERADLVRITAHPDDRRAKLVRFSVRGKRLMKTIEGIMSDLEEEFGGILGETQYATFRTMLSKLRRDL
jgi:DNA-binding MarR family transcriptional regulator